MNVKEISTENLRALLHKVIDERVDEIANSSEVPYEFIGVVDLEISVFSSREDPEPVTYHFKGFTEMIPSIDNTWHIEDESASLSSDEDPFNPVS